VADPGPGKMRWNNASQASANQIVFDAQTADGANMVSYFANVGSAGYMDLRDIADPAKWATYTLTSSNAPAGYQVFGVAYQAGGASIPTGDTVLVTFSPTPPTGVTQVGLVLPAVLFNVSVASVTTTGNLTASLITQNAATFFAGPATGNAATPTFRAFALTDIPATGANGQSIQIVAGAVAWANQSAGTGVGSVGLSMPSIFSVANSPLTANGTLGVTLGTQNAALVFAGPVSGNAAAPTFRSLAGGDVPKLTINTQTANYTLVLADGNVAWIDVNSANATVVTVPSQANVAFANGTSVLINRRGAGNVTISAQANVTVANASSNTIRVQNGTVGLTMRAPDLWVLFGDTT
jgi:hypothetical protein